MRCGYDAFKIFGEMQPSAVEMVQYN